MPLWKLMETTKYNQALCSANSAPAVCLDYCKLLIFPSVQPHLKGSYFWSQKDLFFLLTCVLSHICIRSDVVFMNCFSSSSVQLYILALQLSSSPGWWWTEWGLLSQNHLCSAAPYHSAVLKNDSVSNLERRLCLADSSWGLHVAQVLAWEAVVGTGFRQPVVSRAGTTRRYQAGAPMPWQLFHN